MASNNMQAHGCTRQQSSYNEGTGNSSSQGTQSFRVEGDQYAILEWAHQPHACEMRTASGYDQEDSSSSREPRFEKDLCSASSFHYGVRVCGLERRQHFNSSEATGPFLPSHVKLPPVQARFIYLTLLLFYKIKNKLSPMYLRRLLPQACSTSSHYHLRGHNFPVPTVRSSRALTAFLPRSIILWNDLPPDIQALRTVASFKAALKKHSKL